MKINKGLFSVQEICDFCEKAWSETSNKVAGPENQRFSRNRPERSEHAIGLLASSGRFSLTLKVYFKKYIFKK